MRASIPVLVLALAAALFAATAARSSHDTPAAKTRVLLQWAEGDSAGQAAMTRHARNLLDDLGENNLELEVIAYGSAAYAVTTRPESHVAEDIRRLHQRGVEFRVCRHAMDRLGVKEEELQPEVKPVQGALSEIVRKVHDGWQAVRP
jgi:intracellular sulfur oxidation DsrE/DsrF family protein